MTADSRETRSEIEGKADFARVFDVSRETCDRLALYADLLKQWQKTINLVAPKTLDEVWLRHFTDSAQLFRLIPRSARHLVDLGSGGGFPGLVLAILAAEKRPERGAETGLPGLSVTLVESDTRKAAFLRDVARRLGLVVDIMPTRIESIVKSASLKSADVITSRALAPLSRLFQLVEPLVMPKTLALFLKGRTVADEIEAARRAWDFDLELVPSVTEDDARITVIRKLERKKEG